MTARRRVAWGLLDQVLASASNFLVTIVAARSLSAPGFGGFAVALGVTAFSVFLARGVASDPLSTAHASDGPEELRWAARAGAFTTLATGLAIAAMTALAGLAVGGSLGAILLVLAIVLPGLNLQDYLRYVLIVSGRANRAFVNDLFWVVLMVPAMLLVIADDGGAPLLLLAWGAAGNLSALLGLVQARTWVGRPSLVVPWLSKHRRLWPYFVLDNVVAQGAQLVLVVVISAATSLAQVAGFRGAMTLYAPLAIIGRGVVGVAVPELARRRDDPRAVRRASLLLGGVLAPMALGWAVLTLLVPDSAGRALLGDSWALAEPLVLLGGVSAAASLFAVGTVVGIRALGAARDGLTARLLVSIGALGFATAGAALDGAHGAMLALALSAPLQIAVWWWLLVRASSDRDLRATHGVVPTSNRTIAK